MASGALLLCLATPFAASALIVLNHKKPSLINVINTVAPLISLLALILFATTYSHALDLRNRFVGYRRQYRHCFFGGAFGADICRLSLSAVAAEFAVCNDLYV